jgi:hypothetical protein
VAGGAWLASHERMRGPTARTVVFVTLPVLLALGGCDAGPTPRIWTRDAPVEDLSTSNWYPGDSAMLLSAPKTYPDDQILRINVMDGDRWDAPQIDAVSARLWLFDSEACALTKPVWGFDGAYFAGLSFTGPGICVAYAEVTTTDGDLQSVCWFHAEARQEDPDDEDEVVRLYRDGQELSNELCDLVRR